ncbi:MAG: MoaD/ThiS family protein [Chloroflexi bacterium]|nr:MoaD/ThiS family protein [Chloroflexota bacterium]
MSVRVDFYGIYRPMVGGKTIEFELKREATIRDLLEAVVTRFPPLRIELLDRDGQLYPWIPLFVNGRNPRLWAEGLDRPIGAADVLSIFSPIASGKINVEDTKKTVTQSRGDLQ